MAHRLEFDTLYGYRLDDAGISVPVGINAGTRRTEAWAKVDTGAPFCVFRREHGEDLGLRVEDGMPVRVKTPTGGLFGVFGHTVTLDVLGVSFETTVYFAELPDFPRNLLGRRGWLNRVRLALIDYEGRLYLSPYQT